MKFQYAAELKKRFTCYGHFYELVLLSGERLKCRSVLEMVDAEITREVPSDISEMQPDVVVVMMNPGSSHPKDIYHMNKETKSGLCEKLSRFGRNPEIQISIENLKAKRLLRTDKILELIRDPDFDVIVSEVVM